LLEHDTKPASFLPGHLKQCPACNSRSLSTIAVILTETLCEIIREILQIDDPEQHEETWGFLSCGYCKELWCFCVKRILTDYEDEFGSGKQIVSESYICPQTGQPSTTLKLVPLQHYQGQAIA
jgi:hypothetical protein